MFGSNKNLSLGVGDEDDRQYPEPMSLQRPQELLDRLYDNFIEGRDDAAFFADLDKIPMLVQNPPLTIRDVVMSKFHTAVVTNDPVSNLYICGVGRGGRLGLGDENTQFRFKPLQGPFADRKVHQVALGQNHSLAVTDNGELWTWGLNTDCQLGYALPPVLKSDDVSMSLSPRQVFGPLKKEIVRGIAASAVHSVAHTGSSLYCWGRNLGQLALMDADSRSLEVQTVPRKVAASLLTASIEMVSAIDEATTCLLSNFTVLVFTNYGYNQVRFPFPTNLVRNRKLNQKLTYSLRNRRRNAGRLNIRHVASGGETIAAVTNRGELFTMQLNGTVDSNQAAGSTTNPVKIRGHLTEPECVWDTRKDGVASVSVGEHGSVIICTESGAVWKRVKRAESKFLDNYSRNRMKRSPRMGMEDFKFERIPCVTNCIAVRSSTFGAFAAIRKDSRVMCTDINIMDQSIWDDVGSLCSLKGFKASLSDQNGDHSDAFVEAIRREGPGSVPYELLRSNNIEQDLLQWLAARSPRYGESNMLIRTSSSPDIKLPVHSWLLAARSPVLLAALPGTFPLRDKTGACLDVFSIENMGSRILLTFTGIDVFTLLNIVVYAYLDAIVPVWRYTRDAGSFAARFRQVRTELMRTATKLQMMHLEAAVRLQVGVEASLDADLRHAVSDPAFFDDGDMIIELDGDEVLAHSHLICQRCPFFDAMFHGRAQGKWLSIRRDALLDAQLIRVDLRHMNPAAFHYVMQYLYADQGEDLFNDVCTDTLDEFSELVLDVMGIANELMLDRLSQICQSLIGKFVTTRNVAILLNEISPCSVTAFKDAGLEYICLQLELMLENHLLDGLDDDLLEALDKTVRNNQRAHLPFARSGIAELELHERYPHLKFDIEEERLAHAQAMVSRLGPKVDGIKWIALSGKTRVGLAEEKILLSAFPQNRRKSKATRNGPPEIHELMFVMDEEEATRLIECAISIKAKEREDREADELRLSHGWPSKSQAELTKSFDADQVSLSGLPGLSLEVNSEIPSPRQSAPLLPRANNAPWASPILSASKMDLKEIMQEASSTSALTAGLAAQGGKAPSASKTPTRMSQKERKRQQSLQAEAETAAEIGRATAPAWEAVKPKTRPAPWKTIPVSCSEPSIERVTQTDSTRLEGLGALPKPLLTVTSQSVPKPRAASLDTRFPGQGRANSSPTVPSGTISHARGKEAVVPHSKSYIKPAPKAEATIGMSIADIIAQQQLEQRQIKEAVAKRSLQEIQEEQAFQEWWDQESRRTQEEETRRQSREKHKDRGLSSRRGRKSRGGKSRSAGTTAAGDGEPEQGATKRSASEHSSSRGREI